MLSEQELMVLPLAHGTRRVGRYLLCDQIGSGGMATIRLARLLGPQGFSRTMAVKQLHPQFAQDPKFLAMLFDEARLAARVRHVNVISPVDVVAIDSEAFIVMDYVSGESFANLLASAAGPLHPTLAGAIIVQVLLGLHAAHEATRERGETLGLVHRDVSPQNILVGQDGVVRVLDFGIAKAIARTHTTDSGMVKGKLGYMAPEQIRLEPVDRRADLFCAGVVLWEALTGKSLFGADNLGASIDLILDGVIEPPSHVNPAVTPALDAVATKALARSPDARFQDAMSMASALQRSAPLASAFEIIEWVERVAGPGLEQRAELVRRAEASSLEVAPAAVNSPLAVLATEQRAPHGRATYSAPTLRGFTTPRERHFAVRLTAETISAATLSATVDSGGVAIEKARPARAKQDSNSGRDWRSLGLALGILLASSAVSLGLLVSRSERESAPVVARSRLEIEPAASVASVAVSQPPRHAPSPDALGPHASQPVPSAPRAQWVESAAPSPQTSSRASAPARATPSAAPARRGSTAESDPGRPAAKASDTTPRRSGDVCDPPWVIHPHHVEVKMECLL